MTTRIRKPFTLIAASLLIGLLSGCEDAPATSEQTGYRGTGMVKITDQERLERLVAANQIPEPPYDLDDTSGQPLARDVYENVQVLGHLPEEQFTRLMAAVTEWVSPEQGCSYCHNEENLADDSVYTKIVSRRMFQMTLDINSNWTDHVAETGVTCYTCHRGQPVPSEIWFNQPEPPSARGMTASLANQNLGMPVTGSTSLPYDYLPRYLNDAENIRVHGATALPTGNQSTIKQTEATYSFMIHMSEALGVNCTTCHNSRAFDDWTQSNPQRVTAWHGIQMVRSLNNDYLTPLQSTYPEERLGPLGDAPKANCTTCHQGIQKPLNGVSMLPDFPSLAAQPTE